LKARYHIRNATHLVEWPRNEAGKQQAETFRRTHPEFRRRRIRIVIQACPEEIVCGRIYKIT